MRRLPSPARAVGRVAFTVLPALLVALAGGCGGSKDAGSARERDEERAYGRVVVRSEVTPRRVTLGDPVVWTLTATLPEKCQPLAVHLDSVPASLDLVPRGDAAVTTARGAIVWSRRYDLRAFDLGSVPLPAATLTLRAPTSSGGAVNDALRFPFDSLSVDSLTPAATGLTDPDRGPIDPGLRPLDLAIAGAVVAVVAAILLFLILSWRRRRARPERLAPPEPAEAPFGRAIESLRHDGPDLARDAFHERLSDAIRRYVEGVTGVDAIDLTTRELERELRASPRARPEAAAEIVRILRRSDLVKFARRADAWEEARALLEDAARLSGQVAVAPAVAPAAASGAATVRGDAAPPDMPAATPPAAERPEKGEG